jgi:hypothetical protein
MATHQALSTIKKKMDFIGIIPVVGCVNMLVDTDQKAFPVPLEAS